VFSIRATGEYPGEEMEKLCRTLAAMEDALVALERRGISLKEHAERPENSQAAGIPRLLWAGKSTGLPAAEMEEFLTQRSERGEEVKVADARRAGDGTAQPPESGNGESARWNRGEPCMSPSCTRSARSTCNWPKLAEMGFDIAALIPQERTGIEDAALHAPPRRKRDRPGRSPRLAWRRP
jgi:DNA gyrase subunit B